MSLSTIRGHEDLRRSLARAVLGDHLPQSVLLHGPAGSGKERLALWLAQLLVCEAPTADQGPCSRCKPCRLVERLEHPDLHWYFPLPRPDARSADKLREKLEDARYAELQAYRDDPYHVREFDKAPAHFVAAVHNLQQHAAVRPALGSRKVFVVGDAEAMVPQEASPEAANALLKLLEEPPEGTTLILTAERPGALLPTILSRVLPIRVLPLAPGDLVRLLADAGADPERARVIAARAQGSATRALRTAGGKGEPTEPRRESARNLLLALLAEAPVPRLAAAHEQAPFGARGEFVEVLDELAEDLRDLLALATGAREQVRDPELVPLLERAVSARPPPPLGVAAALERLATARRWAGNNVNPQLILACLLRDMRNDLGLTP